MRHAPLIVALLFLTACSSSDGPASTSPDAMERPDGGVLFSDTDATSGGDRDAAMPPPGDGSMPPPNDGSMPPPGDGSMPPPGDGGMMMGPRPCTMESDCTGNCPPDWHGCTCRLTPMGMACIPTCETNADCPTPPMGMLVCDSTAGICVPA